MPSFQELQDQFNSKTEQLKPAPAEPTVTRTDTTTFAEIASKFEAKRSINPKVTDPPKEPSIFERWAEVSRQISSVMGVIDIGPPGHNIPKPVALMMKSILVDEPINLITSPFTFAKVRNGTASPVEETMSRRGIAFGASIPAAVLGGILGAPAGPFGSAFGAGALGNAVFSALASKEEGSFLQQLDDADEIKRQARRTGIDALIGGLITAPLGVFGLAARPNVPPVRPVSELRIVPPTLELPVVAASRQVRPGQVQIPATTISKAPVPKILKQITPEERAAALRRATNDPAQAPPPTTKGEQLDLFSTAQVNAERAAVQGSKVSLKEVFDQSRGPTQMAQAIKEAARKEFGQLDNRLQLETTATDIVWDSYMVPVRQGQFRIGKEVSAMKKAFSEQELDDMTFFVEGTENPFIAGDTPGALADRLSPAAKKATEDGAKAFEKLRQAALKSNYSEDVGFLEGYISHLWDGPPGKIKGLARQWAKRNPFASKRMYSTLVEGMREAGLRARTTNYAEILQTYDNVTTRVIANNKMLSELLRAPTPDGQPLVARSSQAPADYVKIANDSFRQRGVAKKESSLPRFAPAETTADVADVPIGVEIFELFDEPLMVHPEIADVVKLAIENPFNNTPVRVIQTINAFAKKAILSASFFHHFALTESSASILGTIKPKFLLIPEIIKGTRQGLHKLDDPKFVNELIEARINLSSPGDVQAGIVRNALQSFEAKTRSSPLLNKHLFPLVRSARKLNDIWDDILWDKYSNGLKAITYYEVKQHMLAKFPNIPEAEVRLAVGEVVNNVYGGQNFDKVFGRLMLTPRFQQFLQMVMLAPDWTISNLNIPAQLVSGSPIIRDAGRRTFFGHAVFLTMMTQILNYTLTGMKGEPHFTWDNDEGHKFDIELPWRNEKERKLYFKLGKQVRELATWAENPFQAAGRKAAPISRILAQQIFERETPFSEFPTEFAGESFELRREPENLPRELELRLSSLAQNFVPISFQASLRSPISGIEPRSPIGFGGKLQTPLKVEDDIGLQFPIVFTGNNFLFMFPMTQSTTPFKTIRNFEVAIKDEDPERVTMIATQAFDNHIDADRMYAIAMRNVTGQRNKAQAEELGLEP